MFLILLFLIIYFVILFSSLLVTSVTNLLLCLVLIFFCLGGFYFFLQAEFIGLSFLILYVGAISILFVFALMALNLKNPLYIETPNAVVSATMLGLVFIFWTIFTYLSTQYLDGNISYYVLGETWKTGDSADLKQWAVENDTLLINSALYTQYRWLFWCAGSTLMVAVISVLALALPSTKLKML